MPDAAQNADSAPADFEGYLALKSQPKSDASAAAPAKEEEAAPASEPEPTSEPKGLTDAEKAERKARNDKRREERWWEERGRLRAEKERLERELEQERAAKPTESAPVVHVEGKPTLQQFLESGKFKTYEEANEAYLDARDAWNRQDWEAQERARTQESEATAVRAHFQSDVAKFAKTHDDFNDVFETVRDALDGENDQGTPLTTALLTSENPAALIYHLGTNDDALRDLADLSERGDYARALVLLGRIEARLAGNAASPSSQAPETRSPINAPRPPRTVSGRGTATSREDQLRAAAEKNDFAAFQAVNRGKAR